MVTPCFGHHWSTSPCPLAIPSRCPWLPGVQSVHQAQPGAQGRRVLIDPLKIGPLDRRVIAHHLSSLIGVSRWFTALEGDVGVVGAAPLPSPRVPTPPVPGQRLDHPVLRHKGMDTGVHPRPVPAAEEYLRIWLSHPGGVDHDPPGHDGPSRLIAVALRQQPHLKLCLHPTPPLFGSLFPRRLIGSC